MAKKYRITVNGVAYEVEVEDVGSTASAPAAAPAPAAAGDTPVVAPMPGKVLRVLTSVGAAVNTGDVLLVLEAMKMENEIQAPSAGTVKEIKVSDGSPVNTGDVFLVIG